MCSRSAAATSCRSTTAASARPSHSSTCATSRRPPTARTRMLASRGGSASDSDRLGHGERPLAAAARPVVVAGGGVYWDDSAESLAAFAERAGAPVFMNGAGRGALPSSHPNAFALARGFALGQADLVLVLGTPLDFRLGYGRPPLFAEGAKVVMIDVDPAELARNRPLELGLAGDLDVILRQLSTVVPATLAERTAPWLTAVRARETESRGRLDGFCASEQVPVSQFRLAADIARVGSSETIVVGDGGDIVGCASKVVRLDRPGQWLDPGPPGCLGIGPSFALTAKLLHSERRVLLIDGDRS